MTCKYCNQETQASNGFCEYCGSYLGKPVSSTPKAPNYSANYPPYINTGSFAGGFLMGLFFGIIGLIIGLCINQSETKRGAINGFVTGLLISGLILLCTCAGVCGVATCSPY